MPTASAVLGDLVDAATNLRAGAFRPVPSGPRPSIRSVDDLESAYFVNMTVGDSPGVLSDVAGVFAENGISIRVMQQDDAVDGEACVAFITHSGLERDVQATLAHLKTMDAVKEINSVIRVIES